MVIVFIGETKVKEFNPPEALLKYMKQKDISAPLFALKCKIGVNSVYRYLRGGNIDLSNALKIEKATKGEITVEQLTKKKCERVKFKN